MMIAPPTESLRHRRSLVPLPLASLLLISSPFLTAQSPATSQQTAQPSLRFEVASIYPHQSSGDDPSSRQMLPGGRFVATATTVRTLIRIAFGTDDNLISGAPHWTDSETFDINAVTAGHAEVTTPQQFQQLILSLLEDRFQLKFHRERKEVHVYWLELDKPGKLGPALKPSTPDSKPNMSTNSNGTRAVMKATNMSMADIAAALRRQAGRPVEDHTGLTGTFDFQIEWAPEETADSTDASIFTVLKEQLGLKLRPAKGNVETLVIDHIAEPSDN
jgi:uncharacterized protein (TIGR03435 family)